jgi:hypothetical protein
MCEIFKLTESSFNVKHQYILQASFFSPTVLGIEPRAMHMVGKHLATEL